MTIHARMMSFSLPTQHGDTVHITFPRRRPVVLAFADRQGAEQIDEWVRPLRSRYAHMYGRSLDVQGVADLSEVPALARPLAMLLIRERVAYPVALDWHGEVCRILAVADGQITLFVVAADGHIRLRLAGRATASRLQQLADAIDDVLPAAQP